MRRTFQHTKITFTLGPATESEEMLEKLILTGVDLCRLNMAHASHDWVRQSIRRVKAVCKRSDRHIAIMMDVKGPEIRTGDLPAPIALVKGQVIDFITELGAPVGDGVACVGVNYRDFPSDVSVGNTVLVDSGLIRLEVLETYEARVRCRVTVPARLTSLK